MTKAFLDQIEEKDGGIGAFLAIDKQGALLSASASDERRRRGESRGALDGIPYSAKDNLCTKGLPTTCASKMLEGFVPPYNATVIERLAASGAVLIGKNNLDEFAMGSSTETSRLKTTRNPHDPTRVAGGSSGGSAAAVAAGEAAFSLGSDTGGSVRQPASFCGLVGLKPTYGLLSRYGLVSMASSLDCVGLLTHTVGDCKTVFAALCGKDPHDATSMDFRPISIPSRPLRVAVLEGFEGGVLSDDVTLALWRAVKVLRRSGVEIDSFSLPNPREALAAYSVIVAAEVSSNLGRYDGIRFGMRSEGEDLASLYSNTRKDGFGEEAKRRILFGNYVLKSENRARFYDAALSVRETVKRRMQEAFSQFDLILSPTTPTAAFKIGEIRTPTEMYGADLCTVYANLAGTPALAIPFGKDECGMPLSVQLSAAAHGEELLFEVARLLETYAQT